MANLISANHLNEVFWFSLLTGFVLAEGSNQPSVDIIIIMYNYQEFSNFSGLKVSKIWRIVYA